MKLKFPLLALVLPVLGAINSQISCAFAFEGQIKATIIRGGETRTLLYTIGTNQLRVERGETDRPYPIDIVNLDSGDVTLLFPHNRSFVRLEADTAGAPARPPGFPGVPNSPPMPGVALPNGRGPQPQPAVPAPGAIGFTSLPARSGMPQMEQRPQMPQMPPGIGPQGGASFPAMPMMMPMPMEKAELIATGDTTNLLGYACERYELKQRGQVMQIWATDKLLPFEPYMQNQPRRFGPRMIEEQWGELLKAKKLFPLLAVLRFETPSMPGQTARPPGPERLRFEVQSITSKTITDDSVFEPPSNYQELQPLPF